MLINMENFRPDFRKRTFGEAIGSMFDPRPISGTRNRYLFWRDYGGMKNTEAILFTTRDRVVTYGFYASSLYTLFCLSKYI